MYKKGDIGISIGTIVAVIIALVVFTAGVYFLMDFLGFARDVDEDITITTGPHNQVTTAAESRTNQQGKKVQQAEAKREEPIVQLKETPVVEKDCVKDLSCEYYFVFVPIGDWNDKEFEVKVEERMLFMTDISKFKDKKVGTIRVPVEKTKDCNLKKIDPFSALHHQRIKSCADKYADSLGIDYERAIGLSKSFDGGRAFFGSKVMFAALGFSGGGKIERIGIVAHELGHTYDLCDEYSFSIWKEQKGYVTGKACENKWPEYCDKTIDNCEGNTPTFMDYSGDPLETVCEGTIHYSIMGFSMGNECGLDRTGGYEAYGDIK